MHSLATCDATLQLQQASFLPGSAQPRYTLLLLPSTIGFPRKGSSEHRPLTLRPPEARLLKRMGNGSWWKRRKRKKREEEEVPVTSAQEPKKKGKTPGRSPTARSGNAIRVWTKDGESYAEILKAMQAKVSPQNSRAEVLSIRRTRRSSTRPSQGKRLLPCCASRLASQNSGTSAGCGGPFNRGGRSELARAR